MTVIMNPPFLHGIHIKIILKVLNYSSKSIVLSPSGWLKDPLLDYKKSTGVSATKDDFNNLKKHLKNLVFIDELCASKYFKSGQATDLGIQVYTLEGGYSFSENSLLNKIFKNFRYEETVLSHLKEKGIPPCVKIPHMYSGNKIGKYITENKDIARRSENNRGGSRTRWLNFDTEEEAENCRLSFQTHFWKWLVKSTCINNSICKLLPYMNDYTQPWNDERFYKYFNLNEDEIKIIESF